MEITHVRFAKDFKDHLGVQNEGEYYAGVLYPDSRYLTNIDRFKTHGDTCPQDPFQKGLTDFEKGWAIHLFYDKVSGPLYRELSPWEGEEIAQGNRLWQFSSAAKIVEDIQSYHAMRGGVQMVLDLAFSVFPNNETAEQMNVYADIQKDLYCEEPTITAYRRFWEKLTNQKDIIDGVMAFAEQIQEDEEMQEKIRSIYPKVVDELSR